MDALNDSFSIEERRSHSRFPFARARKFKENLVLPLFFLKAVNDLLDNEDLLCGSSYRDKAALVGTDEVGKLLLFTMTLVRIV